MACLHFDCVRLDVSTHVRGKDLVRGILILPLSSRAVGMLLSQHSTCLQRAADPSSARTAPCVSSAPGQRRTLPRRIHRGLTARLKEGGLAIPPPLLSRTYQVLSDGMAAAMQGRKLAYAPG